MTLIFFDRQDNSRCATAEFTTQEMGCVICPETGLNDEPCECPCHSSPMDIRTFIVANLDMGEFLGADWHQVGASCATDEAELEACRMAIAVPATIDTPCECGGPTHIRSFLGGHRAVLELHSPRDGKLCGGCDWDGQHAACPTVRTLATMFDGSHAFQPIWAMHP